MNFPLIDVSPELLLWRKLFPKGVGWSNTAKFFKTQGRITESEMAFALKWEIGVHAILAGYINFNAARDRKWLWIVGTRRYCLHLRRRCKSGIAINEGAFIKAKVAMAKLVSNLHCGSVSGIADFGDAIDGLDILPAECGLVKMHVKNGFEYWKKNEKPIAVLHCRLGLEKLRRIVAAEHRRFPSIEQRRSVRRSLDTCRSECDKRFLSLPSLRNLFFAIDSLDFYTTTRIIPATKRVQIASKLARMEHRFNEAKTEFDAIESDLIQPPFYGDDNDPGFGGSGPAGVPVPKHPKGPAKGPFAMSKVSRQPLTRHASFVRDSLLVGC